MRCQRANVCYGDVFANLGIASWRQFSACCVPEQQSCLCSSGGSTQSVRVYPHYLYPCYWSLRSSFVSITFLAACFRRFN